MRIEKLRKDKHCIVNAIYKADELMWTETYVLNEEGLIVKAITVFADGTMSVLDFDEKW